MVMHGYPPWPAYIQDGMGPAGDAGVEPVPNRDGCGVQRCPFSLWDLH